MTARHRSGPARDNRTLPAPGRLASVALGTVAAAGLVHLAPGAAAWRRMCCRVAPGLSGVGRAGHVALTFDDGPDATSTPAVLDQLDRLGWRATFFLLGREVERAASVAADIAARGHEIGVHGWDHSSHLRHGAPWAIDDLRRGVAAVQDATGTTPQWFRPPYGALAASSLVAARVVGVRTVLWTCWGRDWEPDATAHRVAATVEAGRRPGATVLLHDSDATSSPGSWRHTLGALPLLAERWSAEGLQVGPLGDHGVRRAPVPLT